MPASSPLEPAQRPRDRLGLRAPLGCPAAGRCADARRDVAVLAPFSGLLAALPVVIAVV